MKKRITAGIVALFMCASLFACSEENFAPDLSETEGSLSAETVSSSLTSAAETVISAESEAVKDTSLTETAEAAMTKPDSLSSADTSDYSERFCDWKYDSSAVCNTLSEFYEKGGSEEMLSAAEAAVRESDIYKENALICQTAELGDDGIFYYTLSGDRGTYKAGRFSYSDNTVDEKGHAAVRFKCAAAADYDGDGRKEAFFLLSVPSFDMYSYEEDCAVFVDSSGKASFLCSGIDGYMTLIVYRDFAHAGLSFGCNNSTTFSEIYAVENGSAKRVRQCGFLGDKDGVAMLEGAPQAPGSWLVVWDNIDKTYKEIKGEKAPDGLAESIFNSPMMEDIKDSFDYMGDQAPEWVSSPEALANALKVYGGKYIAMGDYFESFTMVEYSEDGFIISNESVLPSGNECDFTADLIAAEEKCVPAPVPEGMENIDVSEYSVGEEGVYYSKEELFEAGGEELYNAAADAVKQSRYYKKISFQLDNASKNGSSYTFAASPFASEDSERETYSYDPEYFKYGELVPLFSAAAFDDFDRDGKKEAFITFRLPYKGYYQSGSSEKIVEREIAVFVSSEGKTELAGSEEFLHRFDKYRLIRYDGETHILAGEEGSRIYSLRNGLPRLEISAVSPDGNGTSFNKGMFYSSYLKKYCYAEYVPLSDDLFAALISCPDARDTKEDHLPRRAWICGGRYIITDTYSFGEYLYENGEFTKISDYGGGFAPRVNSQLYCYDVIF